MTRRICQFGVLAPAVTPTNSHSRKCVRRNIVIGFHVQGRDPLGLGHFYQSLGVPGSSATHHHDHVHLTCHSAHFCLPAFRGITDGVVHMKVRTAASDDLDNPVKGLDVLSCLCHYTNLSVSAEGYRGSRFMTATGWQYFLPKQNP